MNKPDASFYLSVNHTRKDSLVRFVKTNSCVNIVRQHFSWRSLYIPVCDDVTSRQKLWKGPKIIPSVRYFTKLLNCSKLLCSDADNKLMIFLELGRVFLLLLHVKIRELSLAYYRAFPFSIIAVDVHSGRRSGWSFSDTNLFSNHSNRQS